MVCLVQFLAAGVNGAANGSATFVLRGTASSAASVLYTDFEATAQPGTNIITLDANGSAEIYTDAYCDVTLKTSAGATLRTVTIGNAATTVEVISDSFTGTDYSGSPTAANEPITLAAVLNKWDDSAGADDWKVAVNGVATNLSVAFSAIGGLFFNVKDPTYGAVGDGVTDDTTAIGLAITAAAAAGGGIVFFPASTSFYLVTSLPISAANITLMGVGPRASIIRSATTSANVVVFTDNTATGWKRIIGLGIQGTGANANALFQFENNQNLVVENCDFSCTSYTGPGIRRSSTTGFTVAFFNKCKFTFGASNTFCFLNAADDLSMNWNLTDCYISIPVSFIGDIVEGPDFTVQGCTFDASSVTSGTYTHIAATSNQVAGRYIGRFVNNVFIDGGSSAICFDLTSIATNSDFYEDGNQFVGFTAPSSITATGAIYTVSHASHDAAKIYLGSRKGRTIELSHASTGAATLSAIAGYEHVFINYTGAGNATLTFNTANMINGAEVSVVLLNSSGAQRDIVTDVGESVQTYSDASGTSGIDITVQPNDAERVIWKAVYSHFGSGAPLCHIIDCLED